MAARDLGEDGGARSSCAGGGDPSAPFPRSPRRRPPVRRRMGRGRLKQRIPPRRWNGRNPLGPPCRGRPCRPRPRPPLCPPCRPRPRPPLCPLSPVEFLLSEQQQITDEIESSRLNKQRRFSLKKHADKIFALLESGQAHKKMPGLMGSFVRVFEVRGSSGRGSSSPERGSSGRGSSGRSCNWRVKAERTASATSLAMEAEVLAKLNMAGAGGGGVGIPYLYGFARGWRGQVGYSMGRWGVMEAGTGGL